jgi:hypothetical protein
MALLRSTQSNGTNGRRPSSRAYAWTHLCIALLLALLPTFGAEPAAPPPQEYQIKAVFLFNFAQFVSWPASAFPDAESPFVIGVLGKDPFAGALDEAVRGEKLKGRSFVIEHYNRAEEIKSCHILFVSRSEVARLPAILSALKGRSILTVSDADGFVEHGGIIRFVTEQNKVRFRINLDAAKAADLVLSSKLLRPADVVTSGNN